MGEDDLDNLSKTITGEEDEDEMDERLNDAAVHMKDRHGKELTPREVIDALSDEDDERSADAADELERLAEEDPESLKGHEEALLNALETNDSWARRAAMAALAKVGSEKSLRRLEEIDLPEAEEAAAEIRERHRDEPDATEEEADDESSEAEGETETAEEEPDVGHEAEEIEAETEGAAAGTTEGASASPSTTDGGTETTSSAASTGEGRALDAAKNGNVDVDFSEIVVLQMLESDKEEPNIYAEESLRYAIREYPDMAMEMTNRVAERLTEGRDDVRRYASIVMHEVSKEYVEEAREYIPQIVESLRDDDEEISQRGEEALTNIAEEYPDDVVGKVAQLSKND